MQVKRKKRQLAIAAIALITLSIVAGAAPQSNVRPAAAGNRLVSVMHLPDTGTVCDTDGVGPNGLKAADLWAIEQLQPRSQTPKNQMVALAPQAQGAAGATVQACCRPSSADNQ